MNAPRMVELDDIRMKLRQYFSINDIQNDDLYQRIVENYEQLLKDNPIMRSDEAYRIAVGNFNNEIDALCKMGDEINASKNKKERRSSVYALCSTVNLVFHEKTAEERTFLTESLSKNILVRLLNHKQKRRVIDVLKPRLVQPGEVIIRDNEMGNELYIVGKGTLEIFKETFQAQKNTSFNAQMFDITPQSLYSGKNVEPSNCSSLYSAKKGNRFNHSQVYECSENLENCVTYCPAIFENSKEQHKKKTEKSNEADAGNSGDGNFTRNFSDPNQYSKTGLDRVNGVLNSNDKSFIFKSCDMTFDPSTWEINSPQIDISHKSSHVDEDIYFENFNFYKKSALSDDIDKMNFRSKTHKNMPSTGESTFDNRDRVNPKPKESQTKQETTDHNISRPESTKAQNRPLGSQHMSDRVENHNSYQSFLSNNHQASCTSYSQNSTDSVFGSSSIKKLRETFHIKEFPLIPKLNSTLNCNFHTDATKNTQIQDLMTPKQDVVENEFFYDEKNQSISHLSTSFSKDNEHLSSTQNSKPHRFCNHINHSQDILLKHSTEDLSKPTIIFTPSTDSNLNFSNRDSKSDQGKTHDIKGKLTEDKTIKQNNDFKNSFNKSLCWKRQHSRCPFVRKVEVLDTKTRGDVVGEVAILHNMQRTASVRAKDEVLLWVLTQEEFYTISTYDKIFQRDILLKTLINHSVFADFRKYWVKSGKITEGNSVDSSFCEKNTIGRIIDKMIANDTIRHLILEPDDFIRSKSYFVATSSGIVVKIVQNMEFSIKPGMVLNSNYKCLSEIEGFYVPKTWV